LKGRRKPKQAMKQNLTPSSVRASLRQFLPDRWRGFTFNVMSKRKNIPSGIKNKISKGSCVICGLSGLTQVDHILPVAKGGTNEICNLQGLCRQCNNRKGCHKTNDDLVDCYFSKRDEHIRKHAWYLSMVGRNYWDGPIKEVYDLFLIRSFTEAF